MASRRPSSHNYSKWKGFFIKVEKSPANSKWKYFFYNNSEEGGESDFIFKERAAALQSARGIVNSIRKPYGSRDPRRAAERRSRHPRRRNPDSSVGTALTWLGGGAIVGAGLGAIFNTDDRAMGALSGAESGAALVSIGGLLVAIFDKPKQPEGFATAGIGLGGLVLLGIAMSIANPNKKTTLGRPRLLSAMTG